MEYPVPELDLGHLVLKESAVGRVPPITVGCTSLAPRFSSAAARYPGLGHPDPETCQLNVHGLALELDRLGLEDPFLQLDPSFNQ